MSKLKVPEMAKKNRGHTKSSTSDFKDHIFKVNSLYLELCISVNSIVFK